MRPVVIESVTKIMACGTTLMGYISGSLAKDIVTAAQFTIFTFQLFQTLTFSGCEPTITAPGISLMLAYGHAGFPVYSQSLGKGTNYRPL